LNKRNGIVLLAVVCVALVLGAIIYYAASFQNSGPNPTSTPSPQPTTPTAQEGYIPVDYWNTIASTGFDAVDPQSNKSEGPVTFTISKGKTGIAVLDVQSVKAQFPSASPTGKFNVSYAFEQLPEGITITFDPADFTISPEQGAQVRMIITINQNATLTGKVDITGKMACVETETGNPIRTSLDFSIVVTTS